MEQIGQIQETQLFYFFPKSLKQLKQIDNDLILVTITEDMSQEIIMNLPEKIVSLTPTHVCATGSTGELLHDYIDEEISMQDVLDGKLDAEIATSWHTTLEECLWYASRTATKNALTKKVVIIDMPGKSKKKVEKALKDIEKQSD